MQNDLVTLPFSKYLIKGTELIFAVFADWAKIYKSEEQRSKNLQIRRTKVEKFTERL